MPGIRSCVVLHDIIPLRLRDKHPFYEPCLDLMRQHLRKADIIWANSQFTRQDFLSFFPGADGDKVRVALLGGGDHFHAADGGQTESVLRALGIPAHTPFLSAWLPWSHEKDLPALSVHFAAWWKNILMRTSCL